MWAGQRSRFSDWLWPGRSGVRIPVRARFSAPGVYPASCTMGTGSFPGVKSGRDVTLTPHPLLVLWSRKSRAIPLLPLRTVRPVQSLSVCTRVNFTLLGIMCVMSCRTVQHKGYFQICVYGATLHHVSHYNGCQQLVFSCHFKLLPIFEILACRL